MIKKIIAIDPGTTETAFVICNLANNNKPIIENAKKWNNADVINHIQSCKNFDKMLIEMVACYGMPVGKSVFETVLFIGRLIQICKDRKLDCELVYRKDIKMSICGTTRAKDSNIAQALVDKYAPMVSNHGKGTKKVPGYFFGFKADIWQAFAIVDFYVTREKLKLRE